MNRTPCTRQPIPVVDFHRLLICLRAHGVTTTSIERDLDLVPRTLTHLASGRGEEPRHSLGQALITVWRQYYPDLDPPLRNPVTFHHPILSGAST